MFISDIKLNELLIHVYDHWPADVKLAGLAQVFTLCQRKSESSRKTQVRIASDVKGIQKKTKTVQNL